MFRINGLALTLILDTFQRPFHNDKWPKKASEVPVHCKNYQVLLELFSSEQSHDGSESAAYRLQLHQHHHIVIIAMFIII